MTATAELSVLLVSNNHKTINKTDNFLEMSAEWPDSSIQDRILHISGHSVWNGNEELEGAHFSEIKKIPEGIAFGDYDEYIEVYLGRHPGVIFSQIQFNRKSGEFFVLPSMQSDNGGWTAKFIITRGVAEAGDVLPDAGLDLGSIVDRLNHAFKTIEELSKVKLTEEQAFQLASHKHYKGGLYRAVGPIRDADDMDGPGRTLYFHLFPHQPQPWHRNTEEFHGLLDNGQQRFAKIEDDVPLFYAEPDGSTVLHVNLRLLDVNRNGLVFTKEAAEQAIMKLNERARNGALFGEYGQPKLPKGQEGERRALTIEQMNTCCQFVQFGVRPDISQQGKPVHVLTAVVQPAGPLGMEFFDEIKDPKSKVGFAMRAFTNDKMVDGKLVSEVNRIITFDFVNTK